MTASITSNTPTVSGSAGVWSISPDLATNTGLTFSSTTGIISGKPTSTTAATTYTVTVANTAGSTSTTLSIRTAPGFNIDSTGDQADAGVGDNACATAGGVCTLRAAVTQINAMGAAINRLAILPSGTITLGSTITISRNIEIIGQGQDVTIIDGGAGVFDMFQVGGGTIGTYFTSLTLQNSTGKGIYYNNAQPLTVTDIKVSNVKHAGGAAAIHSSAAAGALTISNSLFTDSASGAANPLACQGTSATVTNSRFVNNTTTSNAAPAIYVACAVTVSRCEFSGNVGGGVGTSGSAIGVISGSLSVTNSTFYGNSSVSRGVIYNWGNRPVSVVSTTIVGNTTTTAASGAGISAGAAGPFTIKSSIVANNTSAGVADNCAGTYTSQGYNLAENSNADCAFNDATDHTSATLSIGALQDNGGYTQTMALLGGSTAIQGGPTSATCVATLGVSIDQRGSSRPGSATKTNCDVGAYESP